MNPLTLVKRIQSINSKEADLGISDEASWHAKYRDSAYVFVGGIPYDLSEGDLLAVFAQYGEVVDINLIRDKTTGKSKGFAFLAYEDQRSTILAVDNLNGAQVLGRTIRVDHCSKYVKREEEDEETQRQKREARGVCRAFQRGECIRGASCKFSHDEKRAANTGWGQEEDRSSRWDHDKFDGMKKGRTTYGDRGSFRSDGQAEKYRDESHGNSSDRQLEENSMKEETRLSRLGRDEEGRSRGNRGEKLVKRPSRDDAGHEREPWSRFDLDGMEERRLLRSNNNADYPRSRDQRDWREENRSKRGEVDGDYRRAGKKPRRPDSDGSESRSRRQCDRGGGKRIEKGIGNLS